MTQRLRENHRKECRTVVSAVVFACGLLDGEQSQVDALVFLHEGLLLLKNEPTHITGGTNEKGAWVVSVVHISGSRDQLSAIELTATVVSNHHEGLIIPMPVNRAITFQMERKDSELQASVDATAFEDNSLDTERKLTRKFLLRCCNQEEYVSLIKAQLEKLGPIKPLSF